MSKAERANDPQEILIAEDSPTQAQRLQHILEQQGYRVIAAPNGRRAFEAAQARRPTLIISDIVMPEMDGYELCRSVKADPNLADVPVILVTTLADPEDVIRGLECRADNFILKPYDETHLLNHVQFVLVNRQMRQSEQTGMGLEIFFNGERHFITADRLQILNLLLSTYEAAMQRNRELTGAQDSLRKANSELRELTVELESRVAERTRELERSNEALRESKQLLDSIINNATAVIYVKDLAGRYMLVNRQFKELFWKKHAEVLGKTDYEIFAKSSADAFRMGDEEVARVEKVVEAEDVAPLQDGNHTYLSIKFPLKDADGKVYAVGGVATDITDRKQAERRLQSQFERLSLLHHITRAVGERQDLSSIFQVVVRSLEDHLPIDFGCICLCDDTRESLIVNNVGMRSHELSMHLSLTDQARIDVDGNGLLKCVHGQLVYEPELGRLPFAFPKRLAAGGLGAAVFAPLTVESNVFGILIAGRRAPNSFSSAECEFLLQLSEHVALAANQVQLYDALQRAYDDLRHTQQAVMQQERLRALGQMASGIAHDINNAISPISLYTESLLETEPNLSERARGQLETVQHAIDDVAATVARMREFYRQREPQMTLVAVPLNNLVQQVVELTRARWKNLPESRGIMVQLNTELAPGLPPIMAVDSEVRDALTNLVFNAVDAMPEGGTLTLRTRLTEEGLDVNDTTVVPAVCVEVMDTGIGMDEDTRRRCLEPFFTTKGERGTGLGLAMVYGMVQRHRAGLEIDSAVGSGTTVRLKFAAAETKGAAATSGKYVGRPTQRLRILIIDDDPLLIKSLRETLEGDGHQITVADGGQAGIDAFKHAQVNGDSIDLVFTDLGMPYVDGRKVAAAVKAESENTPIILLTGWGKRLEIEGEIPPHVDYVLSKPPKVRELREAIATCCADAQA